QWRLAPAAWRARWYAVRPILSEVCDSAPAIRATAPRLLRFRSALRGMAGCPRCERLGGRGWACRCSRQHAARSRGGLDNHAAQAWLSYRPPGQPDRPGRYCLERLAHATSIVARARTGAWHTSRGCSARLAALARRRARATDPAR